MNRLKELKVWQKAVELSVDVYKITRNFPKEERFNLTSQINRSAVSVASNIAEGAGRNNTKEFNNFLGIAVGSSYELQTQFIIAHKIGYIDENMLQVIESKNIEIQKMIFNLQKTLQNG